MSDRQDKTFDPTPQRIRKAREEGNLLRSQEITSVGTLVTGISLIAVGTPNLFAALETLTRRLFLSAPTTPLTISAVPVLLTELGSQMLVVMLPFFGALMVAGFALNVAQSGWNLTLKPLAPKGSRIDPLKGLKRIFSKQGLFTLFKALLKLAIVGPLAYATIKAHLPDILLLHTLPIQTILTRATGWILVLVAKIIVALLLLSAIDFFFERWRYTNDLKMSMQEIKDESKEQEGDPQMKGRRRQFARELMRRPRLDHAVLQADVVVTNPTHYAVALRYDPAEGSAPRVLVKGMRKRALRIKELARQHAIPTVEDRPLARALHASVEEDQEIPEELYPAVAALLAEIYRNRG